MTYCTCQPCSVILLWVSLPLCPLISLYMFPSSQCWRRDCRSQSHIPVTFIQLGPVCGVKVGRAKATCILHAGAQLTPPWLPTLSLVTVYTCINTQGRGTRAKEWTLRRTGHLSGTSKGPAMSQQFVSLCTFTFCCYNKRHKWYSNLMQTAANPGIWQQGLQLKSYF